jgi:hypothetical protein
MSRIAVKIVAMVASFERNLTSFQAHWKGILDGQNWWWPPHKLVCGMNTEAALGTTRMAEDRNSTKNKEHAAGNGWTSRSF